MTFDSLSFLLVTLIEQLYGHTDRSRILYLNLNILCSTILMVLLDFFILLFVYQIMVKGRENLHDREWRTRKVVTL